MAKRFTSTEKYADSWFVDLETIEKLMFYYLIDHVDNAGFYEISLRHIQFHLGISKDEILGAIKGLSRGLLGADSEIKNSGKIYLKNFLKHQKISPINPFNSFHSSVLKSFQDNLSFVNKHPILQNLKVQGTKKKDGKIIKTIDTKLINYINKNQGLESPLVKGIVEVIVKDKIINTESFKKQIETEHVWQENFYIKTKFKQGALKNLLDEFDPHLVLHPPDHPERYDLKEYKNHFLNWINKQLAKGLLKNYSKNLRQKGDL